MFDFLGEFIGTVVGVITIAVTSLFSFGTPAPQMTPKPEMKEEIVAEQPVQVSKEVVEDAIEPPQAEPDIKNSEETTSENIATTTLPTNIETSYIDSFEFRNRISRSMVNIFCTLKSIGPDHPLTASGIIIDDRGIIMTNAHVAQYILLDNYLNDDQITCAARAGSPAEDAFEIEILYVSPEWIETQSKNLFASTPVGTGQNDYAFLLIKEVLNEKHENFSYVDIDVTDDEIRTGQPILVAGYPAGILDNLTIRNALFSMTVRTDIKKLLTFSKDQIDVLSTGGSYVAQRGSSGGAVINEKGHMIGLVVTSTQEEDLDDRDLRAITLAHIDRSLRTYSGVGVKSFLEGDVKKIAQDFQEEVMPLLAKILLDELKVRN